MTRCVNHNTTPVAVFLHAVSAECVVGNSVCVHKLLLLLLLLPMTAPNCNAGFKPTVCEHQLANSHLEVLHDDAPRRQQHKCQLAAPLKVIDGQPELIVPWINQLLCCC